jgi:hypothetical protein
MQEHNNEDDHEETGVTDEHLQEVGDVPASPKRGSKKKRDATALRKAPQAPKRFKSSYICFFMAKQPEIKGELGDSATVTAISKRSAEMWYVHIHLLRPEVPTINRTVCLILIIDSNYIFSFAGNIFPPLNELTGTMSLPRINSDTC